MSERRSRAIWRNSLRPTASVLRMFDHVEKDILERRHHTVDAGDIEPARSEPSLQSGEVDVWRLQNGVHGRSEYRGLLYFRRVFQCPHHVNRAARMNFQ